MRLARRAAVWLGRGAGLLLAALAAYLVAAALGGLIRGPVDEVEEAGPDSEPVEIALLYGPIHVDFVLPATEETRAALGFAAGAGVPLDDPEVRHLLVGWGAREFYTTAGTFADITLGATLRAVTGDAAVLRVDAIGAFPQGFDPPRLRLTGAQYSALLEAIADTATGPPIAGAGFTGSDGFVGAAGRFHLFRTCNSWVSRMLRAAGVPAGVWTPTPYAVRLGLRRAGAQG